MKTKVWAHRGASAYAPENTLEAFRLAAEQGADGVELDVQLTRDGKLVVIHDETIERVSDGTGYVKDYTLKELKKFHFNKLHPEYKDAKIPTLEEVYTLLKPEGLTINVELKTSVIRYEGIEELALDLAKAMGMEDRIVYSSFLHSSLVRIKKLNPAAKTGILYSDGWINVPKYAQKIGADYLHPSMNHLKSEKLIKKCRDKNLGLHVWTVNEEGFMKYLIGHKIEAIITNVPDICRKAVDDMGTNA